MRTFKWLKIVYRFRKWLLNGIIGIIILVTGNAVLLQNINIPLSSAALATALIAAGLLLIVICFKRIFLNMIRIYSTGNFKSPTNVEEIGDFLYKRKVLGTGPRIVVIGGGTGISTMLRGLKVFTSNLTAVITVADDGGGSGVLRENLGMLPPGDIRNCLLALAETEPVMEGLLQYRFKDGILKGQSFGNLFLAAMNGVSGSFEEAVRSMSDVLAVTGTVVPVTDENIQLCAELADGYIIHGESRIGSHNSFHKGRIKKVFLNKDNVRPLKQAIDAITDADMIVLGPGSLYTSIIPNLLVRDIACHINKSSAVKVYVCNIMTQPGETDGYTALNHIEALERHSMEGMIDYCVVNTEPIDDPLLKKYRDDGSKPVHVEFMKIRKKGIEVIGERLIGEKDGYIRHQPEKLAHTVVNILSKASDTRR